jgi:acyl-CoA synthetase (NDP forming)
MTRKNPGCVAQALFEPKTVALIGASGDPKNTLAPAARANGYTGRIVPVNPGAMRFRRESYPNLMAVPEVVEHAFIMVPKDAVAAAIEQCVEKKVLTATIYSDGFAETGEEGRRMQEEVMAIARAGGVRVLGPNCIGILSIRPSFALSVNAVLEMTSSPLSAIVSQWAA